MKNDPHTEESVPLWSVRHYRIRAYRDALIIGVVAVISFFFFMKFDLVNHTVSWLHQVLPWEFNLLAASVLLLAGSFVFILRRRNELLDEIRHRKRLQEEQASLIAGLEEAAANIKTLSGLLPICGWCKKIRNDQGYWTEVEAFLQSHTDAKFTHGICPDCAVKFRLAQRSVP